MWVNIHVEKSNKAYTDVELHTHTHPHHILHDLFMKWQSPFRVLLLVLQLILLSVTVFKSRKYFAASVNGWEYVEGDADNWARSGGKGVGVLKHCNSVSLFSLQSS